MAEARDATRGGLAAAERAPRAAAHEAGASAHPTSSHGSNSVLEAMLRTVFLNVYTLCHSHQLVSGPCPLSCLVDEGVGRWHPLIVLHIDVVGVREAASQA